MKKIVLTVTIFSLVINLSAQELYINEFMAVNDLIYSDENGDYDDWIEIFNAGSESVDIGGMYITDDLNNPGLWQIPTSEPELTTIQAMGFIILWADKEMNQGTLHVDMKLSGTGEQIGISNYADSEYLYIDSITFPGQYADQSYGRYPDAGDEWMFFYLPTPGFSNYNVTTVRSIDFKPDFFIYPNPNNGCFTIGSNMIDHFSLELYNVSGKMVQNEDDVNKQLIMNSFETKGIYFVKLINSDNKKYQIKKVIIE